VSVSIAALTIARKCCFVCPFIDVEIIDYTSKVVVYNGVVNDGDFSPYLH
jgi:hypothetical protein